MAILDEVRQNALNYTKTLPDYLCTQVTRRKAAPANARHDGEPSWQTMDTLTIRLSYFEQKEDYKPISVSDRQDAENVSLFSLGGITRLKAAGVPGDIQ